MSNLKEIRSRISSVNSTKQITSAMKMVSAVKLRKAQDRVIRLRPYAGKLQEILGNLTASLDRIEDNPYGRTSRPEKILLVAISSNRGLCGAFNANIARRIVIKLSEKYPEQHAKGQVHILTIGKKVRDILKARGVKTHFDHHPLLDNLGFDEAAVLAEWIMGEFVAAKYDRVELIYNHFRNAGSQIVTREQFLPVEIQTDKNKAASDYIFEPGKESIVRDLIPRSLKLQFFKVLLDSFAGEQGARMTAMHKATDNASDMLRELKLNYNKARQASITNEILEIVSGANALKG